MEQPAPEPTCACPPELDDAELLAAVDKEATPAVLAHLAGCLACTARSRVLADLQGLLRQRLYRVFCLSTEELANYQQGKLIPAEAARAHTHMAECGRCRAELALLAEITASPITPCVRPWRQVVAAPLHQVDVFADDQGTPQIYCAGGLRIVLHVERQHGRDGPRLAGSLSGATAHGVTASLLCKGRVVSSTALNEQGAFMLEHLDSGDFRLSLRLPDYEVIVEALRFS